MVNVNSVAYSPNKGRNDLTKQKLIGQIKLLHQNNRYLAKHLAKKVSEACKLEDKRLLYDSLKLESKICLKSIQKYIFNIEIRLQRILAEISGWLSAFSQIQSITNEAKDKIISFITHLDSTNEERRKEELFPDVRKVSSQNQINQLETVIEDVETPSIVYLRRKRSLNIRKKCASKAAVALKNKNSMGDISTHRETSTRAQDYIPKQNIQDRESRSIKVFGRKKENYEKVKHESEESISSPKESKERSSRKELLGDSRKLRPRKPINYSEIETSSNALFKTRNFTHIRTNVKREGTKKVNHIPSEGEKPKSSEAKKQLLPRNVKKEPVTQDIESKKDNHTRETSRHSLTPADFGNSNDVRSKTQNSKTHRFSDYVPTRRSGAETEERFVKERDRGNRSGKMRLIEHKDFLIDSNVTDNFPLAIKKEILESPEESLVKREILPMEDEYSSPLTSSEAPDNLNYYAAWLRDLG